MNGRAAEAAKPLEVIPIGATEEYRKVAGIWYYRQWDENTVLTPVKGWRGVIRYEPKVITLWEHKRQLGKKQLKALGLRK